MLDRYRNRSRCRSRSADGIIGNGLSNQLQGAGQLHEGFLVHQGHYVTGIEMGDNAVMVADFMDRSRP